jgi:thiol-disulfide isomerase/thioredoxin
MHHVDKLKRNSEPILEYLEDAKAKPDRFNERFYGYKLDHEAVDKVRKHAKKAGVFVFSAEWCPDCYRNVPVLALIGEATGLKVRVFGHLMRDPKSSIRRWAARAFSCTRARMVHKMIYLSLPRICECSFDLDMYSKASIDSLNMAAEIM